MPARNVSMLDLRREYELYRDEIRAAVDEVLESQQFINGPWVARLEQAVAERTSAAQGIAVSSGTDAILCALMAIGIGPGDEVIVPAFTFFATAGCVARLGARPVFAEIDSRTFNLDPAGLEAVISPRTRAIIAVHLFGQCADMDPINAIARRHGLKVVEDAAQALGAQYHGRAAGALGDIACFSFYPTKNLGGLGDGGIIVTSDAHLAALCRQLRQHGELTRYHHDRVGGNFRLDSLQCATLLVKLRYLERFTRARQRAAGLYDRGFARGPVVSPYVRTGHTHVYHQYSILADRRDELMECLRLRGVATGIYYPVPLHLQKCFAPLGYRQGSLPVSEDVCGRVLSLPIHPMLEDDELACVIEGVAAFQPTSQTAGNRPAVSPCAAS